MVYGRYFAIVFAFCGHEIVQFWVVVFMKGEKMNNLD